MIIKNIKLHNFRNYTDCSVQLAENINVFIGDNAQGKTNFLESVAFISTTRSFRTNDDKAMINNLKEKSAVIVTIIDNDSKLKLTGQLFKEGKRLLIQSQAVKKSSEFIGILNAVVFSPDDLELFNGAPRLRRRMCDLEIGKINKEYMGYLNDYQKTLKERNNFLKSSSNDDIYLDVITQQLIEYQIPIIKYRRKFIEFMNGVITKRYQEIAVSDEEIFVEYLSPIDSEEDIREALKQRYLKSTVSDKNQRQTQVGIHKDDLKFYLNGNGIGDFASQGQKRMLVLALKVVLIDYIYKQCKKYPVLLLDDVLSELDITRRRSLFALIPKEVQTIITTTDIKDIQSFLPKGSRIFKINDGMIIENKEMI